MEIKIWEGKATEEELALEMERIAKLIREGYLEGEVFGETENARGQRRHYRGWWKK